MFQTLALKMVKSVNDVEWGCFYPKYNQLEWISLTETRKLVRCLRLIHYKCYFVLYFIWTHCTWKESWCPWHKDKVDRVNVRNNLKSNFHANFAINNWIFNCVKDSIFQFKDGKTDLYEVINYIFCRQNTGTCTGTGWQCWILASTDQSRQVRVFSTDIQLQVTIQPYLNRLDIVDLTKIVYF